MTKPKTILLRPTSDLVEAIETVCKDRGITQHTFCLQAIENEIFREPISEAAVDAFIRARFAAKILEFAEQLQNDAVRTEPRRKRPESDEE